MRFKRLLSFALAATMLFGSAAVLPENSFDFGTGISASAEKWNGFEYELKGTTQVTITAYNGTEKNVTVPKEIDGRKVTVINEDVFQGNTTIENVVIESDLSYIIHNMFKDCTSLKSVSFTGSCTYTYHNVFENCSNLESVKLPDNLKSLNNEMFKGCYKLADIQMSKDLCSVTSGVFADTKWFADMKKKSPLVVYSNLLIDASDYEVSDYTIPSNIKYIGSSAFKGNYYLKSIVVPETVERIGGCVFQECINLEKAVINVKQELYNTLFYKCYKLSEVTIGEGVEKLWNYIFRYCESLKKIKLPSTVKDIGYECFSDCFALEYVDIPYGLESIGYHCFYNCYNLKKLWIPDTVKSIGERAFYNCFPDPMIVPEGVKKIGDKALGHTGSHFDTNYTITGYKDSLAQQYANENGLKFKEITECSHPATRYCKVAVTCENDGCDGDRCRICNKLVSGKEFKATGHNWKEPVWDWSGGYPKATFVCKNVSSHKQSISVGYSVFYVDPTCTKDGKKICKAQVTFNDKVYYSTNETPISKKGHSTVMYGASPATCTETGNKTYWYCTRCNKYFSDKNFKNETTVAEMTIPRKDHSWGKWTTVKKATCTKGGSEKSICSTCGTSVTRSTKALGHSFSAWKTTSFNVDKKTATQKRTCSKGDKTETQTVKNAVVRYAGSDRAETGTLISAGMYNTADTVVIATGFDFHDALAAVPLASAYNAPLLLADRDNLSDKTIAEIKRLKAKNVIVVATTTAKDQNGYDAAIKSKVYTQLKTLGVKVTKLDGKTYYETAKKVADALGKKTKVPTSVFITTDKNYADALSASPVAAILGAPILYIDPKATLNATTKNYLASVKSSVKNVYIVGGVNAVSANVEKAILNILGKKSATRFAGDNRYDTCVMINNHFKGTLTGKSVCIAKGYNFPDALAGGVFAAKNKAPLFLADKLDAKATISKVQSDYLKSKNPSKLFIIGGETAVPTALVKTIAKACV